MTNEPISKLVDLAGKRVIVTGAAMGIGRAIAERLAEAGAKVLIADKDKAAAEATAKDIPGSTAMGVDVSDEAQVAALFAAAVSQMGGIDILVNNAGIYPMKPALDASREEFERILNVNLLGAFSCAQTAAKQMIAQGTGGKIINISSIDALHPSMIGLAFYDASKHGLWGFTKSLALELAPHHIRVNAIAPGGTATPGTGGGKVGAEFIARIPMGRLADADEIARVALFLASDLSSYMTGSQVVADGGRLLS